MQAQQARLAKSIQKIEAALFEKAENGASPNGADAPQPGLQRQTSFETSDGEDEDFRFTL